MWESSERGRRSGGGAKAGVKGVVTEFMTRAFAEGAREIRVPDKVIPPPRLSVWPMIWYTPEGSALIV